MIKVNSQYPSRVKYVKKTTLSNGSPATRFSVGDKIKNSDPAQYINYDVTVFDDLDLQDGDEVVLTAIESIECRNYNGKLYYSLAARIKAPVKPKRTEPVKAAEPEFAEPFDI